MSTPQDSLATDKTDKGIKRKADELEVIGPDKLSTPKRKKTSVSCEEAPATTCCVTPTASQLRTPVSSVATTPKTPVSATPATPKTPASVQRKTVPLSERQQVALLKKIAAEEEESAPIVASPPPGHPGSAIKRTPAERKVNKRNERGETPLHLAAIKGDLKQCKRLIKAGGDVNVKDFAGWSPLHEACNHGWVVIAKQFLKAGADVNAQGLDNDTPLHDAVINGHEKLVKLLLRHGANPRQANLKGKTPLDIASNNPDLLRLLKGDYTASSSDSFSDGQYPTSPESNSSEKHESELQGVSSPGSGDMNSKGDNFSSVKSSANPKTGGSPRLTLKFHTRERTKTRRNEAGYKSYSVTMETQEAGEPYSSPLSSNDSEIGDLNIDLGFGDGENSSSEPFREATAPNQEVISSMSLHKDRARVISDMDTTPTPPSCSEPSSNVLQSDGEAGVPSAVSTTASDKLADGSSPTARSPANNKKESPSPSTGSGLWMDMTLPPGSTLPNANDDSLKDLTSQALPADSGDSPKVPPLRIILPAKASSQQQSSSDLPYIVNASSASSRASSRNSSHNSDHNEQVDGKKGGAVADFNTVAATSSSTNEGVGGASEEKKEEMPRRTLRSHTQAQQQLQQQQQQQQQKQEKQEKQESQSEEVATNGDRADSNSNSASNDAPGDEDMNMHPKRRKRLRNEAEQSAPPPVMPYNPAAPERVVNQLEVFLDIKRQIAQKWQNMYVVSPKPPSGFHDYLINSANYVLEGNSASRLSVPMLSPPQSVTGPMRELFMEHEKERYKLRLRHVMERDKLILSFEQENIRIYGRAARAMANQNVPLSVCTILRDLEIYNSLGSEQEEKNSRTRYNGRLLASWRQDLVDKYEKIKEAVFSRQHHEAESLFAVQKMVWEWKMKEVGLCEPKTTPKIDSLWVPMVLVSDELDFIQK